MNARKYVRLSVFLLCVLCAAAAVIAAQEPQQAPAQVNPPPTTPPPGNPLDPQDPKYRLNINVELVNLTATVLDDQGKYMDGLKLDDFQVFEDGAEQKISFFSHDLRVPISVGV